MTAAMDGPGRMPVMAETDLAAGRGIIRTSGQGDRILRGTYHA
jgi:hypothetical protein